MRVAILDSPMPNLYGGGQILCRNLCEHMNEFGYETKVFHFPILQSPLRKKLEIALIPTQFNLDFADLIIPVSGSTWNVNHPNMVPWIIRQHSEAYEYYEHKEFGGDIRFGAEGEIFKTLITNGDKACLKKAKRIYTISPTVSEILMQYCGIKSEALTIPFDEKEKYVGRGYGDYIFYPGRIVRSKRIMLAVEAMRYVKSEVKLLVAGAPNSESYSKEIKEYISKYSLEGKVKYIDRFITDEEKIDWLSECLGTLYFGYIESYWSLVSTESSFCSKPVITTTDSGATSYLVIDGETGYRPEPNPKAIAKAMDDLFLNKHKTEEMGKNIRMHIETLIPSWEKVVSTLTAD